MTIKNLFLALLAALTLLLCLVLLSVISLKSASDEVARSADLRYRSVSIHQDGVDGISSAGMG